MAGKLNATELREQLREEQRLRAEAEDEAFELRLRLNRIQGLADVGEEEEEGEEELDEEADDEEVDEDEDEDEEDDEE